MPTDIKNNIAATSEEEGTRIMRFVGKAADVTGESFLPEVMATSSPGMPMKQYVSVPRLLEEVGDAPGVRIRFPESVYEASTDGLRMAQQRLETAQKSLGLEGNLPELVIIRAETYRPQPIEAMTPLGDGKRFMTLPTGLLQRMVMDDAEANPHEGIIGPTLLQANLTQHMARFTLPYEQRRQPPSHALEKAVDAIAAQAAGAPCELADALHAATANTAQKLIRQNEAEMLPDVLAATTDRIQALQGIARQQGKPCKTTGGRE